MIHFEQIDLKKDRETLIQFRKDSFIVSFGNAEGFDNEEYIDWLAEKKQLFPDGFVLAKERNLPIGQLELSVREYEGKDIGYVHLYYLIPDKRGTGLGRILHHYTLDFFKKSDIEEYHLRVAPNNEQAIRFYLKNGMEKLGEELDGKVIRMRGKVNLDR